MKIKPKKKAGGIVAEKSRGEEQFPASESGTLPVFKLKRILVPIDFSECSKKALQYAVPFAQQFNASLILFYVIESYSPIPEMAVVDYRAIEDQVRKAANQQMSVLEKTIPETIPKQTVIKAGNPSDEIVAAANELNADVIILSTHGRTGLKHFFLGSVAERVVRHAPCPVMVVREREHDFVETK